MDTQDSSHEEWRPVPSTDGALEASSLGRIRRVARPLIYKDGRRGMLVPGLLRGTLGRNGYMNVSIGKRRAYVHRLVAEVFLEPVAEHWAKATVNHINGDKTDNRAANLEWASFKHNNTHAREQGLCNQHGERTNLSKYSDQFIDAVRNVHAAYAPNYEELGRLFGLTGTHARQIVLRLTRSKPTTKA